MTRMVTAMFDTRAAAESAAAALMRELSLDRAAVRLHGGDTEFNDATAHVIAEIAARRQVKSSRIAHGVPVGGELEYVDGGTLAHALAGRQVLS